MTPTVSDLLKGCFVTFMQPVPPEQAGEFMASKIGIVGMTALLAAQEADKGPAARLWEIAALQRLFADCADAYDAELGGRLAAAAGVDTGDGSLSALDAADAELRRTLTALHTAAETRGDLALDARILDLYVDMAEHHRLDLPPMPAS